MSASQGAPQVDSATAADVAEYMREMDSKWEGASRRASAAIAASCGVASDSIGFQRTSDGWVAIVQLGPNPANVTDNGTVAIIDDSAGVKTGPWVEVFEDPSLHLSRETKLIGPIWEECFDDAAPPLHINAESWVGAIQPYDENGDWQVWVDGEMWCFSVDDHDLWGTGPALIPARDWLTIASDYTGIVIRSDDFGCLWGDFAERATVFFGRPPSVGENAVDYLWELLSTDYTDCDYTAWSVECDSLAPGAMMDLVAAVGSRDPNFDEANTSVWCQGFSGTAEELRLQVLDDGDSAASDR
ncbi:hypothetical protein YM304_40750 [Ilumatobacter coccineus YM16-304]|uniref:Uncharacterized protein n=2 Tax=Ilumatobacter coccineus TaxID=467094 RepID=A0A6C7EGX2_ILUCY|nr:hypothetical protein YM304_40750 [Ilumatobacter coccineus YM16-304]